MTNEKVLFSLECELEEFHNRPPQHKRRVPAHGKFPVFPEFGAPENTGTRIFLAPEAPERSGASGGARIYSKSKFAPEISGAPAPSSHKLTAAQAAC